MPEITNKLLKQAIADAEAVRETAVANAKLVLEESITPQIRDMIARRLRVEAETTKEEDKDAVEKPHEEGDPVGSSQMPADTSTVGSGDNKEPSDDSFDSSDVGTGPESQQDSNTEWYDKWADDDLELESVIKELEEDLASFGDTEDDDEEEEEDDTDFETDDEEEEDGTDETSHAADGLKFADASLKTDAADDKFGGIDKGQEDDKFGGKEDGEEGGEEGWEDDGEEGEDDEIDLEEILAQLEADNNGMKGTTSKDVRRKMAEDLARLKAELAQYREAVETLRTRLQEVNLLNAKLLFTNKMFRKEGLSNEQKVRIVESFDRASTVREVKLVYTALVENLSLAARTFNASRKKVVVEGLASKATHGTAPKRDVIVENENAVANRLKELAGLI